MKLELFYFPSCPFCQFVLTKIQQLQLGEHIHLLNTIENEDFRQRLARDTGRTTVPCLYIDNSPMFESADIIYWLERNQSKIKEE